MRTLKWQYFIRQVRPGDFIFFRNHNIFDINDMLNQMFSRFCHCEFCLDIDRKTKKHRTVNAAFSKVICSETERLEERVRSGKLSLYVCRLSKPRPNSREIMQMRKYSLKHIDKEYDRWQILGFALYKIVSSIPFAGGLVQWAAKKLKIENPFGSDENLICSESVVKIARSVLKNGAPKWHICARIPLQNIAPGHVYKDPQMKEVFRTEKD